MGVTMPIYIILWSRVSFAVPFYFYLGHLTNITNLKVLTIEGSLDPWRREKGG